MPVSQAEVRAIKRVLCMPTRQAFVRCPSRNGNQVRRFEAKGDYSHSGPNHVCAECRCKLTAGRGTYKWGDFYGIGVETGHHGCGWCYRHEKKMAPKRCIDFARSHMKSLQQVGRAATAGKEYVQVAEVEAREAKASLDLQEGMDFVREKLRQFKDKCDANEKYESEITHGLMLLSETIKNAVFIDGDKAKEIQEMVEEKLFEASHMTESAGGHAIEMTDKTKFDMAIKLSQAIVKFASDKFRLESADYIHIDELKMRIPQMINATYRFILDDKQREVWINEFRSIWDSTKRGVK